MAFKVLFRPFSWPGNIRELENMLARTAAMVGSTGKIDARDLPLAASRRDSPSRSTLPDMMPGVAGRSLQEIERMALMQTLSACAGNRAEAARLLGVAEKTVYNMMRRHGLVNGAQ